MAEPRPYSQSSDLKQAPWQVRSEPKAGGLDVGWVGQSTGLWRYITEENVAEKAVALLEEREDRSYREEEDRHSTSVAES